MNKLTIFLFSSILGRKIYDEFDEVIGTLKDVYVTTGEGYPRIIGYKVKTDSGISDYEFRNIEFYEKDNGTVRIQTKGTREILPRNYTYLLSQNLLDRKIVDINGRKVVRVDDLRIVERAGEYRVIAVETGNLVKFRRKGLRKLGKFICKLFSKKFEEKVLMWDDVESLEMVNDNLKIAIPYKKLQTMHPADLADILEELDDTSRKKVFESLDEDLAADTLEEIEPEVQSSIIREFSQSKTADLFENIPNDEIADILDELSDEEREKILISLEKEDAEEVKELLSYEEESVGSIMNKDFISFNLDVTVGETIELLRDLEADEEVMYYIYITDEDNRLKGVVTLRDLILNHVDTKLKEIMHTSAISVKHDSNIEDAVEKATKYDLLSIPVVDYEEKLLGIVLIHDIMDELLPNNWKRKFKKAN
ncbi:magnesium transporter [Clostridium tarantellae]|uniref:CBS domain-containing protein n=1 Tax=Clostridium tarantellae TaxID=39493 RepID=A0A6I1MIJ4_9CLOT|nr:CBS domain-containing protein [Clostridium tarantellae]MPQ43195.1 CBS domain-containing protein [Clostridium tarantellae]